MYYAAGYNEAFVTLEQKKEDAIMVQVESGEQEIFICNTALNAIKVCVFVDPSGERTRFASDIKYDDGRLSYFGDNNNNTCGLKIDSIQQKDSGIWKYLKLLYCTKCLNFP